MEIVVKDVPVHYREFGSGIPVLAIHGWFSAHQEIAGFLEPFFAGRPGYRRIYPDLPGMGRTPAPDSVNSSDDLLDIMLGLVDSLIGADPFLVVGHSYGGYLARAIANRRPGQVAGLALVCPMTTTEYEHWQTPEHAVIHASGDLSSLDPQLAGDFRNYFVVHTPATLSRFQEAVVPVLGQSDAAALERIDAGGGLRTAPEAGAAYTRPTLFLLGRQDSTVGYADQWRLLEHYSRATFAVLDRAGHALPHEQPTLLDALMGEWLDRVAESSANGK